MRTTRMHWLTPGGCAACGAKGNVVADVDPAEATCLRCRSVHARLLEKAAALKSRLPEREPRYYGTCMSRLGHFYTPICTTADTALEELVKDIGERGVGPVAAGSARVVRIVAELEVDADGRIVHPGSLGE